MSLHKIERSSKAHRESQQRKINLLTNPKSTGEQPQTMGGDH
uniref:Uncharacterized protein n=1 Tax=Anguilla anguilla TaxID=7936 RepID=A0A0E9S455_ANGAN